jgi:hypothetical protein
VRPAPSGGIMSVLDATNMPVGGKPLKFSPSRQEKGG